MFLNTIMTVTIQLLTWIPLNIQAMSAKIIY